MTYVSRWTVAVTIVVLAFLVGCGGGGAGDGTAPPPASTVDPAAPPPASPTDPAAPPPAGPTDCTTDCTVTGSTASVTVGPGATTITYTPTGAPAGTSVVLTIPAGALTETTTLTLVPATVEPPDAGVLPGLVFELGPSGQTFLLPLTLTLTYGDGGLTIPDPPAFLALTDGEGALTIPESDLAIATVDAGEWIQVLSAGDAVGNTLSASIGHFSRWGARRADTTAPTQSTQDPPDAAGLGALTPIVIRFSERMAPASLALGGSDLSTEAAAPAWSKTVTMNDTLTVTPGATWSAGPNRTLTVAATDVAGNPLATLLLTYTADPSAPTATVNPADGAPIAAGRPVVITFSKTMNPAALSLGGSMALESDGVWGWWMTDNDTLILLPDPTWSAPPTLTVDGEDSLGNALVSLNLSYTLDTTSPALTIANLRDEGVVHSGFLVGTASDANDIAWVGVSVDGGSYQAATGTSSWKFQFPTNASTWRDNVQHTVVVRAMDLAGNATISSLLTVRKGVNKDVNGDGYADVVVGDYKGNSAYVFHSTGAAGLCAMPPCTSPSTAADTTLTGSALSQFGYSVALGDVNGDGYADVVVGAYNGNSAYVFHSTGLAGLACTGMPCTGSYTAADTTLTGSLGGVFGSSVALGDVNGDGYADVVVGSPQSRAFVFHSTGTDGLVCTTSMPCESPYTAADTTLTGSSAFGSSVALGDVNGDGYADVVVGSPGGNSAYVFHSTGLAGLACTTSMPCTTPHTAADNTLIGTGTAGNQFGFSLALGDVNGDGYADVVVGDNIGNSAYVFHSTGEAGLACTTSMPCTSPYTAAATTLTGPFSNSYFGNSVALGDVNGDGYADLTVGAPVANAAYVFHGFGTGTQIDPPSFRLSTAADTTLTGSTWFGSSVALGDVNGDGYADVVVGAFFTSNSAYVFHSKGEDGLACTGTPCTSLHTAAATTLTGPADSWFGSSVALGDVNGDDFAGVGAMARGARSEPVAACVLRSAGSAAMTARPADVQRQGGRRVSPSERYDS